MKEVLSKGLDYLWGNIRLNPIKEALYNLACIYKGHKPVRNTGMFILWTGGMVGGWFLFAEVPAFYDWGNHVVSGIIPDFVINGLDGIYQGAGQFAIDCATATLGLWIGGTLVGTTGKQIFRALTYQIGGNTNTHFVFTGSQLDFINEEIGLSYQEDPELKHYQIFTRAVLQNCCPVICLPHVQKKFLSEEHWQAQRNTQAVLDELIADLNTYKYDGTHRKAEMKYAVNEALRGVFKPLLEYLSRRQEQAERRATEAQHVIDNVNTLIGDEGDYGLANSVEIEANLKKTLEQFLVFYEECDTPSVQYNVFPKVAKEESVIKTYGDLYYLREKAKKQKVKQELIADRSEKLSVPFRASCAVAAI